MDQCIEDMLTKFTVRDTTVNMGMNTNFIIADYDLDATWRVVRVEFHAWPKSHIGWLISSWRSKHPRKVNWKRPDEVVP